MGNKNKGTELSVEDPFVSKTEEGAIIEITCEGHDSFILWCARNCSNQISSQRPIVNTIFYVEVLKCLHKPVRRKRPEKWKSDWLLHHDKEPSHTSLLGQEFMAGKNMIAVAHPLYSPDLAPCDFWLFPKLKIIL